MTKLSLKQKENRLLPTDGIPFLVERSVSTKDEDKHFLLMNIYGEIVTIKAILMKLLEEAEKL